MASTTRTTINLPGEIGPLDRGVRFEDPLGEALGTKGAVVGGGSELGPKDDKLVPLAAEIEVELTDREGGLAVVRAILKQQGAPAGTKLFLDGEWQPLNEG